MGVVKNNKGFTLVDIVCAMAILALVAMPICSGFMTAAKSHVRIQEKTQIVNTLNNELAKIIAEGKVEGVLKGDGTNESLELKYAPNQTDPSNLISHQKVLEDKTISVVLIPKVAISGDKVAYVEVILISDDPETSDVTEDYKVSGVWVYE